VFTVAAQNVHQATPVALSIMKEESLNADSRGFVLPVPLTMILFRPWQRVSQWRKLGLNPFELFLDGLATMGPRPLDLLDNVVTSCGGILSEEFSNIVAKLKADRQAAVMLPARLGSTVRHAHVLINVDGALDIFFASVDGDLVGDVLGRDPVRFSFVQEMIAGQLDIPIGVLYQIATSPRIPVELADVLFEIPAADVVPDPWLTDEGEEIPETYRLPVRGLSLGRWTRELSNLLVNGPECAPGEDPWLEGVARPLWGAWRAFKNPGHDRIDLAKQSIVGLPARDWAQACWEWLEAQAVKA